MSQPQDAGLLHEQLPGKPRLGFGQTREALGVEAEQLAGLESVQAPGDARPPLGEGADHVPRLQVAEGDLASGVRRDEDSQSPTEHRHRPRLVFRPGRDCTGRHGQALASVDDGGHEPVVQPAQDTVLARRVEPGGEVGSLGLNLRHCEGEM